MSLLDWLNWIYHGKPKKTPPKTAYPKVTSRVAKTEEESASSGVSNAVSDLMTLAAKFPFQFYEIIDQLALLDPYISKYHHTTVSLGNTGHKIQIQADNESKADEVIQVCNDFAARCFPLSGGMDGLVNGLFSQIARSGGVCVEWVPDLSLSRIEKGFIVPVKTIRFRYNAAKELELLQNQVNGLVPLNPVQTVFHAAIVRDGNPYPVPPALAAVESCAIHRQIMSQIKVWMEKVSALGVLLAKVEPPPREPGETQAAYDNKSAVYLNEIANSLKNNLNSGLGVGYSNIEFNFQNTHSGAQGARDILQIVLQGLFAALQRDPVFFGWNWNTTETFARVIYEELQQGIKNFQLGVKRVMEHGHRLNLALQGYGDVGISVSFNRARSIDAFREAEASLMESQGVIGQFEAGIINDKEARRLLGHDEKKPNTSEFIASFSKEDQRYRLLPLGSKTWRGAEILDEIDSLTDRRQRSKDFRARFRDRLSTTETVSSNGSG